MDDQSPTPMARRLPAVSIDGAPSILLAGQQWPVPQLAPRQLRRLVPLFMRLRPWFTALAEAARARLPDAADATVEALARVNVDIAISPEVYDGLVEAAWLGVSRAHRVTQDELLDWPIDTAELVVAFPILLQQAGLTKVAPAGEQRPAA